MKGIKKALYESYKWLYEEAIADTRIYLRYAKIRREMGYIGWAAEWLIKANETYKTAIRYKKTMEQYAI